MKTTTKNSLGVAIILCGSLFGFICAQIFHWDFSIAVVISTILATLGLCFIASGMTPVVELVPERRYKVIDYTDIDGTKYATLKYMDDYGIIKIHTFTGVEFKHYVSSPPLYIKESINIEPTVGRVYTASKEKWNNKIVLKYIQD